MKLDGFVGPSYTLDQPSASSQRLVNLYLENFEVGPPRKGNTARIIGTPGLRKKVELGAGPIRGLHRATTGQLFAVSGNEVFELLSDFTATSRTGTLGSTTGRVTMADDGTHLLIGDGTSTAYQTDLGGTSVAAVADADCPGGYLTWQDGYFIHTAPNTGQFQISGLNDVTYDALDVATAEGRPDKLVMVISANRQLWLFGEATTEVWWNSGAADFPFARNESGFIETGTVAAATCVRAGGSVVWVGNDERGRGTVWYAQGLQPSRISTHAVEFALSGYTRLSEAFAFAYQQRGHEFYQLTVPATDDGTDPGGTWVYDFSTGQWHERSFLGTFGDEPHRASCATVAFGQVVAGDREDGRIYTFDAGYYLDDTQHIRRIRQAAFVSQGEKLIRYNSFELQAEAGVGPEDGSVPSVNLDWSDDGGHTWSNSIPRYSSLGAVGQYSVRVKWRRLGMARDRVFRVQTTDPMPISWLGAEIDVVQLDR